MGLTMIVDGIGRGHRRSSAGGSPGAVGEARAVAARPRRVTGAA